MEDKTATRRHSRIPLRQRTTRWTVLFTRIQKRARRAQIIPHPQELSKLQRVGRREKPLLGRSSTTTRKHSSWASRPRRATSPPSANKTGGRHPGTAKDAGRRKPIPRSPREDLHDTRWQTFQQAAKTSHQTSLPGNLRTPGRPRVPVRVGDRNHFLPGRPPASRPPTRARRASTRGQNRKLRHVAIIHGWRKRDQHHLHPNTRRHAHPKQRTQILRHNFPRDRTRKSSLAPRKDKPGGSLRGRDELPQGNT